MNFIKTNECIYKVDCKRDKFYFIDSPKTLRIAFDKSEVIDKSDNLEELCDALIVVCKNHNEIYSTKNETVEGIRFWYGDDTVIYGAIFVTGAEGEPILKSVCKADKKGELKLL